MEVFFSTPLSSLKIAVIIDEIYFSRFYDIMEDVKDFEVIVDVGAHIGLFSLKVAKKAECKSDIDRG